ncbi:MAG TPA: OsmC family protein [Candidatus Dormibacteraeota bacterium]|nr:OsmC family protein [Candidatus Dormibacteraeota bacterium]
MSGGDPPQRLHRYRAAVSWEGSTQVGYEGYARAHRGTVPPAAVELPLSADPAFRGDAARTNPEQLVLLAAASCQLLSFLAVAARARVEVVAYSDDAEAEMRETGDATALTAIRLRPRIAVRPGVSEARLLRLVALAHRQCYIANSLRTEMTVAPVIEWRPDSGPGPLAAPAYTRD